MPPLTMIRVMPNAPIATITVWVRMILKLPPVRKYGRTSLLSEKSPITNRRPIKRAQRARQSGNGHARIHEFTKGSGRTLASHCPAAWPIAAAMMRARSSRSTGRTSTRVPRHITPMVSQTPSNSGR
jgi:hypothetical protein